MCLCEPEVAFLPKMRAALKAEVLQTASLRYRRWRYVATWGPEAEHSVLAAQTLPTAVGFRKTRRCRWL